MVFFFFGERGACVSSSASWSEAWLRVRGWTCLVSLAARRTLARTRDLPASPSRLGAFDIWETWPS